MASPFKFFRKNQKLMLAFLGVAVMIGFVILPVFMQGESFRRQGNPRVAICAKYGDLHESNLINMRRRRQAAIRFLEAVSVAIAQSGQRRIEAQDVLQEMTPSGDASLTSDEALVESWLLARRAEELGLIVDDHVINAFLTELAQEQLTKETIEQIRDRIGVGEDSLFSVLEEELLAMQLRRTFHVSLGGMTPAQRWDYFQRLNREVTIESAPVRAADFVDRVAAPDEAALKQFFEQHEAQPYDPTSPDPGFRQPHKIAIEYLKAEHERFADPDAVTDEEVSKYYEENKDRLYKQEELPKLEDEDTSKPDVKPGTTQPEAAQAKPPPEQTESPVDEEESPGQAAPDEDAAADAAPSKPDTAEPAEAPREEKQPPMEPAPAEGGGPGQPPADETSLQADSTPFRLASLLQTDAEQSEPAGGPAGPEQVPDSKVPAGPEQVPDSEVPAGPEQVPDSDVPAGPEEAPDLKVPAGPEEAPDSKVPAEPGQSPDSEERAGPELPSAAADQSATEAMPQYVPLEKVEDEIRRLLARGKANEKIVTLLNELRAQVGKYRDELTLYEAALQANEGDQTLTPPVKPDFRALAKQHGLIARKTQLISALEARDLDIGSSRVGGRSSFIQVAFQRLPTHKPEVSQDWEPNYYLFWKVEEVEERIPEFDEEGVRDWVLRQWKLIQAFDLAEKEAGRLASQAREARKPLKEVFADRDDLAVTESESFSWLTFGWIPGLWSQQPPRISEVEGVELPGNEFMEAVFGLDKAEVGTAPNYPRTIVYVIRVADSSPLPETLWRMFVAENFLSYFRAASYDNYLAQKAWVDEIKAQAGFRWDPEWQRESLRRQRPSR